MLTAFLALAAQQPAVIRLPPPQPYVVPAPKPTRTPPPVYDALGRWNPAIGYVNAGQDEPGYRSWYLALPARRASVKAFNDYLALYQASGVIPTWQLIRTASSWSDCSGQPYEVPPQEVWPNIVQTLRYVRDYVVPAIGPVEAVSAYRNPDLNHCAGGAPESAHKYYSAVDMVPLRPTTREQLMRTLCDIHARTGEPYHAGLGFYAFLRFHIDTMKFRRWGTDPSVVGGCPPIIRAEDASSVGQPFVPPLVVAPGSPYPPPPPPPAAPPLAPEPEVPPVVQTPSTGVTVPPNSDADPSPK